MATPEEQLQELNEIIAGNVKSVASKGTRIEYQSVDDALKAKRILEGQLEGTGKKSYRIYDRACHDKGL